MCGIVGAASTRDVVGVLIEGIKKLEYRGYDSAGIAFLKDGHLERLRSTGRVAHLEEIARKDKTEASTGLSHTRWATHGAPSEANAHPHFSAGGGLEIAVVHNGIVENYEAIRAGLSRLGYSFSSETDTEVLAHHVHSLVTAKGLDLFDAVMEASREWEGAYAAGFISSREPDTVVGARKGSPLLVGLGQGENFLASDASALISRTRAGGLPARGRHRRGAAGAGAHTRRRGPVRGPEPDDQPPVAGIGGARALCALHAEGDLRAAGRARAIPSRWC